MSVAQFEPLKLIMEWKFMGRKARFSEMGQTDALEHSFALGVWSDVSACVLERK